jgi:inorganic pyrophosphatase
MNSSHTIEVCIEVERGSFIKRRPDGQIDFISPIPSPFSYGSVLGTSAADGDPEDALVVGQSVTRGESVRLPVWGQVRFIDGGVEDHKWVLSSTALTPIQWRSIEHFFRFYAVTKRLLYAFRSQQGGVVFEGVERYPVSSG